ncbi:hypothetical protein D9M73_200300 [compost metagenome]
MVAQRVLADVQLLGHQLARGRGVSGQRCNGLLFAARQLGDFVLLRIKIALGFLARQFKEDTAGCIAVNPQFAFMHFFYGFEQY